MADTDNPVTGKDTKLSILVDGVSKLLQDQIVSFEANPIIDEIGTKVLGSSGQKIDAEYAGWELMIEFAPSTGAVDEIVDVLESSRRLGLPTSVIVADTTTYRDLTKTTHTYLELVMVTSKRSKRRAQAQNHALNFKTGKQRIST